MFISESHSWSLLSWTADDGDKYYQILTISGHVRFLRRCQRCCCYSRFWCIPSPYMYFPLNVLIRPFPSITTLVLKIEIVFSSDTLASTSLHGAKTHKIIIKHLVYFTYEMWLLTHKMFYEVSRSICVHFSNQEEGNALYLGTLKTQKWGHEKQIFIVRLQSYSSL